MDDRLRDGSRQRFYAVRLKQTTISPPSGGLARMTITRIATAKKFLAKELERLNEQEREIVDRFINRKGVARNIEREFSEQLTTGERIADRFAAIMGSWPFIIVQSTILAAWVILNLTAYLKQWDPYPFILLNLALSFQAAYAAPIIMMSQNRQADKDRLMAEHDYQINKKAEQEVKDIMHHLEQQDEFMIDILRRLEAQHDI